MVAGRVVSASQQTPVAPLLPDLALTCPALVRFTGDSLPGCIIASVNSGRYHAVKKLSVVVCLVALAAITYSVGPASAGVRQCKTIVYKNGPVYVTSASGITCAYAATQQRYYKWTGKNTFRTPGGYDCKPSGRGKIGYQIRCVKLTEAAGPRVYRIEFAD